MTRQQARRQHRERLTGAILAVLGIVVLVVAVVALTEPKDSTKNAAASTSVRTVVTSSTAARSSSSPSPSKAPAPSRSSGSGSLSIGTTSPSVGAEVKQVPLVVLNNTTAGGLATDAAARFRKAGWTVSQTGNLRNDIISTCAYYDPASPGAQAAANALRDEFPTIKRVEQKFPELPSGPVVVVITSDYTSG